MPTRQSLCSAAAALSLAVVSGSPVAHAEQIDLNAVLLARLKTTAANTRPDGYSLKSVQIKGDVASDGIRFQLPSIIPENALVLMQSRVSNCNDRESTGRADVNKTTQSAETFSKASMLGGSTSVTVSYKSPIGMSGSATQTFNYSTTKTEETTATETVSWASGINVPVGPRSAVTVQFVVAEQKLERVPWSTNVIVSGPVELTYEKPTGSATLCVFIDGQFRGFKKCWTTSAPLAVNNFKEFAWDGLPRGGFVPSINDQISSFTLTGSAQVTFYTDSEYRGTATTYAASTGVIDRALNDTFSSMKLVPTGVSTTVTQNLETLLGAEQRKVALSGTYRGTNGVYGDFRISSPVPLSTADCGTVITTMAAPASTAPASARVVSQPLSAPLQGKVLQRGVKPASRR